MRFAPFRSLHFSSLLPSSSAFAAIPAGLLLLSLYFFYCAPLPVTAGSKRANQTKSLNFVPVAAEVASVKKIAPFVYELAKADAPAAINTSDNRAAVSAVGEWTRTEAAGDVLSLKLGTVTDEILTATLPGVLSVDTAAAHSNDSMGVSRTVNRTTAKNETRTTFPPFLAHLNITTSSRGNALAAAHVVRPFLPAVGTPPAILSTGTGLTADRQEHLRAKLAATFETQTLSCAGGSLEVCSRGPDLGPAARKKTNAKGFFPTISATKSKASTLFSASTAAPLTSSSPLSSPSVAFHSLLPSLPSSSSIAPSISGSPSVFSSSSSLRSSAFAFSSLKNRSLPLKTAFPLSPPTPDDVSNVRSFLFSGYFVTHPLSANFSSPAPARACAVAPLTADNASFARAFTVLSPASTPVLASPSSSVETLESPPCSPSALSLPSSPTGSAPSPSTDSPDETSSLTSRSFRCLAAARLCLKSPPKSFSALVAACRATAVDSYLRDRRSLSHSGSAYLRHLFLLLHEQLESQNYQDAIDAFRSKFGDLYEKIPKTDKRMYQLVTKHQAEGRPLLPAEETYSLLPPAVVMARIGCKQNAVHAFARTPRCLTFPRVEAAVAARSAVELEYSHLQRLQEDLSAIDKTLADVEFEISTLLGGEEETTGIKKEAKALREQAASLEQQTQKLQEVENPLGSGTMGRGQRNSVHERSVQIRDRMDTSTREDENAGVAGGTAVHRKHGTAEGAPRRRLQAASKIHQEQRMTTALTRKELHEGEGEQVDKYNSRKKQTEVVDEKSTTEKDEAEEYGELRSTQRGTQRDTGERGNNRKCAENSCAREISEVATPESTHGSKKVLREEGLQKLHREANNLKRLSKQYVEKEKHVTEAYERLHVVSLDNLCHRAVLKSLGSFSTSASD